MISRQTDDGVPEIENIVRWNAFDASNLQAA